MMNRFSDAFTRWLDTDPADENWTHGIALGVILVLGFLAPLLTCAIVQAVTR